MQNFQSKIFFKKHNNFIMILQGNPFVNLIWNVETGKLQHKLSHVKQTVTVFKQTN